MIVCVATLLCVQIYQLCLLIELLTPSALCVCSYPWFWCYCSYCVVTCVTVTVVTVVVTVAAIVVTVAAVAVTVAAVVVTSHT